MSELSMNSTLTFYLTPLLLQVALTYLVAGLILVTRLSDILSKGTPRAFYEQYSGVGGPPLVQRTTNQLTNLFEFPVLFLAVVGLAVAANVQDDLLLRLAWIFVVARCAHTFVHMIVNVLWVRMTVFMLSNVALLGMWIRLAWAASDLSISR